MKRDASKGARRRKDSKHKHAEMKKPAREGDEKPAHTDASNDEFSKLEHQYDNASIEERDRLHPDFIRAIRRKYPGLVEGTWQALRNGDGLKVTIRHSMKRALGRHDLSVGRKTNAREDADAAMWLIDELRREDLEPREMREHGYELGVRTLFIGLQAGYSPNEVENLYARLISDRQREFGKQRKKERPRAAHARELISQIRKEHPEFNHAEIVEEVARRWQLKGTECFTPEWLRVLVHRSRPAEAGSPRKPPRRRTYPLKRFRV